jgi:hypothetical protein
MHGVGVWALTYILVFVNRIDLLKGMMISRNLFVHRHPGGTISCIDSPFLKGEMVEDGSPDRWIEEERRSL